jgi:hypothetical protein
VPLGGQAGFKNFGYVAQYVQQVCKGGEHSDILVSGASVSSIKGSGM